MLNYVSIIFVFQIPKLKFPKLYSVILAYFKFCLFVCVCVKCKAISVCRKLDKIMITLVKARKQN